MQIFEVNAWLTAINEAVTLGRVWMETHDRTIFKQVWEELRCLVTVLTGRPLLFKGLHVHGTILGLNADMEVAPLLGFAEAILPNIDREELRGVVTDARTLLPFVLRLCYTHIFRIVETKADALLAPSCNNPVPLSHSAERLARDACNNQSGYAEYDARRAAEINVKLATGEDAELKQAVAESKLTTDQSNSSGRVPARRPSKGKKAEKIAHGTSNVKQVPRCSPGRVVAPSHSAEEARVDHQEDDDVQHEKEGQTLQTGNEAAAPAPKPKWRKAGDPLTGWAIELVPGDKTTAVSPWEYAQKEPEEFAAQYP
ncbi:hypothetical protein B0H14DRAFT_3717832 [Mycena olivaceomarginata]|nr:hypothetical protein B0H14DRAFT_3717832 [Mycena olivaceomarginata]